MASKLAQFFQMLTENADAMRHFQDSAESREALLTEAGFDAAERALIQSADSQQLHARMMADNGVDTLRWANNNNSQNIGKFKRPDANAR